MELVNDPVNLERDTVIVPKDLDLEALCSLDALRLRESSSDKELERGESVKLSDSEGRLQDGLDDLVGAVRDCVRVRPRVAVLENDKEGVPEGPDAESSSVRLRVPEWGLTDSEIASVFVASDIEPDLVGKDTVKDMLGLSVMWE